MLAKLSIGEFIQRTSKFVKPGSFILTRYGKPLYEVSIKSLSGEESKELAKTTKPNLAKTELAKNPVEVLCKYSGCLREGSYFNGFCMEHWRDL